MKFNIIWTSSLLEEEENRTLEVSLTRALRLDNTRELMYLAQLSLELAQRI